MLVRTWHNYRPRISVLTSYAYMYQESGFPISIYNDGRKIEDEKHAAYVRDDNIDRGSGNDTSSDSR